VLKKVNTNPGGMPDGKGFNGHYLSIEASAPDYRLPAQNPV